MTSQLKSFQSGRRGATVSGLVGVALASALLLCGAGNVPVENFTPQGPMQADLNAGNHSVTNAATVSATNFAGPAINLTNFPSAATMGLGTAATNNVSAFDANGAAAAVLATSAQKANNGSDFASAATTRTNLGVPYNQVIAESTSNTVTTSQTGALFNYTTGSSALTPTIPSASSAGNGATYFFRKTDSGTGSVLVNGVLLGKAGHTLEIVSDGTSWYNRSFFGGIDSSGNISLTAPVNGNIALNTSGTGAVQVNGNAMTAPGIILPAGPTGGITVMMGDSRISGGQGRFNFPAKNEMTGFYKDTLANELQEAGFFSGTSVFSSAVPGTGIEDGVSYYTNNGGTSFTTTGNITQGSNTVTVTGSTSGISGLFGIGGIGIPAGERASISGSTITLNDFFQTPPQTPSVSTTGATLDICTSNLYNISNQSPAWQTPHELSPAVTGNSTGYLINAYGINDVQTRTYTSITASTGSKTLTGFSGLTQLVPGYAVTDNSSKLAGSTVVVSNTATTITVNNFPIASGSTTITVTPVASAWETAYQALVNLALADSYKVICVTIPKAWTGAQFTGDSFRQTFNSWILSTYGGGGVSGVSAVDSASMSIWGSNNPTYYYDGLHFTTAGESMWSTFISSAVAAQNPSLLAAAPPAIFGGINSVPADWVMPPNRWQVDPNDLYGTNATIGSSSLILGDGTSSSTYLGVIQSGNCFAAGGNGNWYFDTSNSGTSIEMPLSGNYNAKIQPVTISTITGATTAIPNNLLMCNSSSAVAVTLPDSPGCTVGDTVEVDGIGSGGWTVTPNSAHATKIAWAGTLGTTNVVSSVDPYDAVKLRYLGLYGGGTYYLWEVVGHEGSITLN